MDVDRGDVGEERGQRHQRFAGERALNDFGGAVFERVGAEHGPHRQERHAHRRGLEPYRESVVRPLRDLDVARLHDPAGVRR